MTVPSTEVRDASDVAMPLARPPQMLAFDPFQLMDRLDEEALNKELEGRVANELVYVVKDGGQEVVGLSKAGVDECCMALVTQGQVIREEDLEYTERGEGVDAEALFKVRASRYAVSPDGREVRLDSVIGVKRQPLYREASTLTLDSNVPGKKYRGKTYRDLLASDEGRDYLGWMSENFREEAVREFVRRLLNGEEVTAQGARPLNPHWYEHGAMKAARNARFRLIPGKVRAAIITQAREAGQVHETEIKRAPEETAEQKYDRTLKEAANRRLPGKEGSWGGYANRPLSEVPRSMLDRVTDWCIDNATVANEEGKTDMADRLNALGRDIAIVLDARARNRMPEPPHKDGSVDSVPSTTSTDEREREPGEEDE